MPYLETIDEDLARAKSLLADGTAEYPQPDWMSDEQWSQIRGGTIYGKDIYAAYKLLESFVEEIERLQLVSAENVQIAVTAALKTIRCDCGALMTYCCSCAVADWQAAHPDCPTCCPPPEGVVSHLDALRSRVAELERELSEARHANEAWLEDANEEVAEVVRLRQEAAAPDVGVYCAHCEQAIHACPSCGKTEWRKGTP